MFKDKPDVWHKLPVTNKGLLLIPLTQEACDRLMTSPPPPPPEPAKDQVRPARRSKKKAVAGTDEGCKDNH